MKHLAIKPDITWYKPVTWEELIEAARPLSENEIQSGEVPWVNYKNFAVASLHHEIDEWYRKTLKSGVFQQIDGTKDHGTLLDHIRDLMIGLSEYSDTWTVLAWSVSQEREITQLEKGNSLMNRLLGRDKKSQKKREDLERYDKLWRYKEKFRGLENSLLKEYEQYALSTLENLANAFGAREKAARRKESSKPVFRPIYTPIEFEHYCSEWMVYLGFREVRVSKASGDGGVDIFANGAVAQVKFYNTPIGVSPVRELLGASLDFGAKPFFFSSMSYTQAAIEFADRNGVALFVVDIFKSEIKASSVEADISLGR